jgi:predicted ribosome quality control (RQC) complex YloA/Tae2 family protein
MQFIQIAKDKFKTIYVSNPSMFQIIAGRTREGNDRILTDYMSPEHIRKCYWYHVANDTSSHVILYNNIDTTPSINNYLVATKWIRQNLYKPSTKNGEQSQIMIARLLDVAKTNTLGLVHVKNSVIIGTEPIETLFVDNENNV